MSDHARTIRGRDAIAAVLLRHRWLPDTAIERANNVATALSGALPGDDVVGALDEMLGVTLARSVTAEVLAAWAVSERAPGAGEATR